MVRRQAVMRLDLNGFCPRTTRTARTDGLRDDSDRPLVGRPHQTWASPI